MLSEHGVVLVGWVNDLFPLTRPEWFTPDLARVFTRHADNLLGAATRTLAISQSLVNKGIWAVRVHSVAPHVELVK
jgi:hypothetical protein